MANEPLKTIFGISPLGGNGVEGTDDGMAEVRDSDVQGVPLVFDGRVSDYISEQAKEELDDKEITLAKRKIEEEELDWKGKAGYRRSIE